MNEVDDEVSKIIAEQADEIESLRQQLIASDPTEAQSLIRSLRAEIASLEMQLSACIGQMDALKRERNEAIRSAKSLDRQVKAMKRKEHEKQ